jgi:hypothetical protein
MLFSSFIIHSSSFCLALRQACLSLKGFTGKFILD